MVDSHDPTKPLILVGEDSRVYARLISGCLRELGFEVVVAEDGERCLAQVKALRPNLLILDLVLPKLHGIDVLRAIRADPALVRTPVLMCTARTYNADVAQLRELGVIEVLPKPFTREELASRVLTHFRMKAGGATAAAPTSAQVQQEQFLPQLSFARGYLRLWGTRGSVPVSGPEYVRHGGNTTCAEVHCGGETLIFDAGTGIRQLGQQLAATKSRRVHLFVTHTHWDHVQGFPFFVPAYVPGFEVTIYGASGFGHDLESVFRGQLDRDYFPVQFDDMRATLAFKVLGSEPVRVGEATVRWEYVTHPGAAVGYRVDVGGKRIALLGDNEFLLGYKGAPQAVPADDPQLESHATLLAMVQGVDLLVAEAQYTNEEYLTKVGWGHSSLSSACLFAKMAGARSWIVTHHDPCHGDEFLQKKLLLTRQVLRDLGCAIDVQNGYDGMTLPL